MRTTPLVMAAALALTGCGGGPEPQPELNPALGGTWTGNTLVSVPGIAASSYPSLLEIAVTGNTATISRLCPDGSGTVAASGSGNAAAWTGRLTCPPVAIPQCASVTAILSSASGSLSADGATLTALAGGTGSGCGYNLNVTLTFVGTR